MDNDENALFRWITGKFDVFWLTYNPKYKRLYHEPCYSSIRGIHKPVDLAVIATPASTVPEIIHACSEQGIRSVIIISAGFNEGDVRGLALKKSAIEAAHQYQIRILGPNSLGLIRPAVGLNATFSKNTAVPGQLALVSQSGALCTAILDWAAPTMSVSLPSSHWAMLWMLISVLSWIF